MHSSGPSRHFSAATSVQGPNSCCEAKGGATCSGQAGARPAAAISNLRAEVLLLALSPAAATQASSNCSGACAHTGGLSSCFLGLAVVVLTCVMWSSLTSHAVLVLEFMTAWLQRGAPAGGQHNIMLAKATCVSPQVVGGNHGMPHA
jgi:hypothetical protein